MESTTKQDAERLAAAAADAHGEEKKAQAAVRAAESEVGRITGLIVGHDGSSPGIEELAGQRSVAEARVQALSARLVDKRQAHAAAVAESQAAQRELDVEVLAEVTAALDEAGGELERTVGECASRCAESLTVLEQRRMEAWLISRRVQVSNGVTVDNLNPPVITALTRPDILAHRFEELLGIALHAPKGA